MSEVAEQNIHPARWAWQILEPYHAMIYFVPEAREAYSAAGLKGFWMGYFASRAAAFGPVPAPVVTATFYNFHHRMVERSIPDAWKFSTPEKVLAARLDGADLALRRLLGEEMITSPKMAEAAELARQAVSACDTAGRALFAAHLSLAWPQAPHLSLWHAATLLREYRGDGHMAALLTAGLDGCEALLTMVGTGKLNREHLQPHRGWNDEEWQATHDRLVARGLLQADTGELTEAGWQIRHSVEELTDRLANPPWQALGESGYNRLLELVRPFSARIIEQGGIPVPNPVGMAWPFPRSSES